MQQPCMGRLILQWEVLPSPRIPGGGRLLAATEGPVVCCTPSRLSFRGRSGGMARANIQGYKLVNRSVKVPHEMVEGGRDGISRMRPENRQLQWLLDHAAFHRIDCHQWM